MERVTRKSHLTLIQGGGETAEPIETIPFYRLPETLSRGKLAWIIGAKLLLLASVLYVIRSFSH